jgi:hypothetical protein
MPANGGANASFLCLIMPLCSYLYGGLYWGLYERAHIIRYFPLWSFCRNGSAADGWLRHVALVALGLFSYEGARSFVTDICCTSGDYPYKRDMGRHNDKMPSSKPAAVAAASRASAPAARACRAERNTQPSHL